MQKKNHLIRYKKLFAAVQDMILEGQEKGVIKGDLKARHLTYIFMGPIDTFILAMVLDKRRIKSDEQKKRIADGIFEMFMNGAKKGPGKSRA